MIAKAGLGQAAVAQLPDEVVADEGFPIGGTAIAKPGCETAIWNQRYHGKSLRWAQVTAAGFVC
jgi:hypothetical protein